MKRTLLLAFAILGCSTPTQTPDGGAGSDSGAPIDTGPLADVGPLPDTGPLPDSGGAPTCDPTPSRSGDGTYYDGDGTGNCGFAARPDMLFAAMNDPDYEGSEVCGTCVAITGPSGSVTVTITDRCPECASGDLDLSMTAFARIAELSAGRVPISWHEVPCDVTGPVRFRVYTGSNPYYLAFIVENARNRVVNLERETSGGWVALDRQDYNVWIESPVDGAPVDTAHLRATDVNGNVVDATVPITEDLVVDASGQFEACAL